MSAQPPDDSIRDDDVLDEASAERIRRVAIGVAVVIVIGAIVGIPLFYRSEGSIQSARVPEATAPLAAQSTPREAPRVRFVEITDETGIDFVHQNGALGEKLLPETMGSGCAFLDYDGDGDADLFLVNSCRWPHDPTDGPPATQALYRNDGGRFTDVTEEVGLDLSFYGMGACVGDYDDDGDDDLYVTAVGPNHLLRNDDGKRFEDVTIAAGATGGDHAWSTSAAFLDHDGDGDLDLFILNYVTWSREIDLAQGFQLTGLGRAYGPPKSFQGAHCVLLRNDGTGRFEDVSESSGVQVRNRSTGVPVAKALGLAICDLEDDGDPDVLVANDTVRNFAFRNLGDGRFEEVGAELGIAFDSMGNARGAMGISAGDYRNDGVNGVAIGNFANEMTALFVKEPGTDFFFDEAPSHGLGAPTRDSLTFGVAFFDYDLDGRLDLVCANGHVEPDIATVQESQSHAQSVDLFWNAGGKRFIAVTPEVAGPDLFRPIVGRAVATADIDGDGDLDLCITENAGPAHIYRNDASGSHSLRLDLRTESGRRALGARVEISTSAGRQRRYLGGGTSYLAESEQVVTFGLGGERSAGDVTIRWRDGTVTRFESLEAGLHVITKK